MQGFIRKMKVSGEGEIYVAPDQAIVTLGAITENMKLEIAQTENAQIIAKVISAMEGLGIAPEDIQTVTYRIDMNYDYQQNQQIFKGYRITHQLQVKVRNIQVVGTVVDTAVQSGANSVTNIEFAISNVTLYYRQALNIAYVNAFEKACSLAQQIPVNLHPIPLKIDEIPTSISPIPRPYAAPLLAKAEATPIQVGEMKIAATVIVDYCYF